MSIGRRGMQILPSRGLPLVVFLILTSAVLSVGMSQASFAQRGKDKKDEVKELTLKELFPDKSHFGPSASRPAFSTDGRYAAFLYRTYKERRHGNDLWLYDFMKDEMRRITSVSVMAEFEESVKKVKKERIKKAKSAKDSSDDDEEKKDDKKKGKKDKKKKQDADEEDKLNGDWVSDKDADDEDAVRYAGVSSYEWNPVRNEIIFSTRTGMFLLDLEDGDIKRIARLSGRRLGQILPDGSGYMLEGGSTQRVKFGSDYIEEFDKATFVL